MPRSWGASKPWENLRGCIFAEPDAGKRKEIVEDLGATFRSPRPTFHLRSLPRLGRMYFNLGQKLSQFDVPRPITDDSGFISSGLARNSELSCVAEERSDAALFPREICRWLKARCTCARGKGLICSHCRVFYALRGSLWRNCSRME